MQVTILKCKFLKLTVQWSNNRYPVWNSASEKRVSTGRGGLNLDAVVLWSPIFQGVAYLCQIWTFIAPFQCSLEFRMGGTENNSLCLTNVDLYLPINISSVLTKFQRRCMLERKSPRICRIIHLHLNNPRRQGHPSLRSRTRRGQFFKYMWRLRNLFYLAKTITNPIPTDVLRHQHLCLVIGREIVDGRPGQRRSQRLCNRSPRGKKSQKWSYSEVK